MKLIICDEKPEKEETCDIWLETVGGDYVRVVSRIEGKISHTEVTLYPDMRVFRINGGNFKWDKE